MTLGDVKARRRGSARMAQIAIHHLAEAGARKDRFPGTDHLVDGLELAVGIR